MSPVRLALLLTLGVLAAPGVSRAQAPADATLPLRVLPDTLAVCPLPRTGSVPWWAEPDRDFAVLTRTPTERSVVVTQRHVPAGPLATCERDWRPVRVAGTLPLNLVGIVARMTAPLAEAGISLFAISTFETDYVLVKERDLERAVAAWGRAGHRVTR